MINSRRTTQSSAEEDASHISRQMHAGDVRPFSDKEYALLVLRGLKHLARRSEWIREAVPPRFWDSDEPSGREIADALAFAIDAVRAYRMPGGEE